MTTDFSRRTAAFAVGELATFSPGPRAATESGASARWRMELGAHWHRELQAAAAPAGVVATNEVPVSGAIAHRGWLLHLDGRIDQRFETASGLVVREIKTTLEKLPRDAAELRAAHPAYFVQLGLYLRLLQLAANGQNSMAIESAAPSAYASIAPPSGELVFVEAGTGLQQIVRFADADDAITTAHLDIVVEFLEQRRATLERLRKLEWRPAFAAPRPGQETIVADLRAAVSPMRPVVLAAPTGYGKTGVLLETAFATLREGHADRVVYLTGKSTGQLHVVATLSRMLSDAPDALSAWNLRPKREHCINDVFHCTRDRCRFLHDIPRRYRDAGLARFHLFPSDARDLPALRAAGLAASVCPYEIARAALPACSVWLGDFNYLFAPANRGIFIDQPTWDPARTLLVIDEAHHLPSRVADAYSHALSADELHALLAEISDAGSRPLIRAMETLWRVVSALPAADALDLDAEDDLAAALRVAAEQLGKTPPDTAALSTPAADLLFRLPELLAWLDDRTLEKLLWSPREATLRFTCLDAASAIADTLRPFAGVVLATATPPPADVFAAALGLTTNDREGENFKFQTTDLPVIAPPAPWREQAYDVALDLRVDTTFRQRDRHLPTTAATLAALRAASPAAPVAAFFPSYAYAEKVIARVEADHPGMRCVLQPRSADLAAQEAWIDEQLALTDVVAFVLGGSFAEGIDHLGGRVSHALVVGPALPEVNALQRAREAALARHMSPAEAFRRTYLVPGLQKVNQALGRLARAPGQHCRVILQCRRFADAAYASLLAPEYQLGCHILDDSDLAGWLDER